MKPSLKQIKPKTVSANQQDMVQVSELQPGVALPLLITPNYPDIDVAQWVANNQALVEDALRKHGGILFRGFPLQTQEDFDHFVSMNCKQAMEYKEGATPRSQLTKKVYTSTEFPADQRIHLHNELSYVTTWPMRIYFFSIIPAAEGGETPIADMRRVYEGIDPVIRSKFEEKGWMLVRNYGDGFGAKWQYSFRTESKEEVEAYCRANQMEFQWKSDDRLVTRQVRPAVTPHPVTGEKIWFNHVAFWHESSLDPEVREMFVRDFGHEGLPYNTFYGDGTPIEDEIIQAIHAACDRETVAFLWQKGDLLMLDNMLAAHGRSPFKGERKTVVSMGEPYTRPNQE